MSGRSTPQPGPTATLKRSDSKSNTKKDKNVGDLFKSFAKAKPKTQGAEKSKESTPAPAEDEQMQGMSEDEGDDDDTPEVKFDDEKTAAARKAKEDREDKLRQMMEPDGNTCWPRTLRYKLTPSSGNGRCSTGRRERLSRRANRHRGF